MPDCHVNRIFEVISPLTVWHILTCSTATIFTCHNRDNIVTIFVAQFRGVGDSLKRFNVARCSGFTPLSNSFSYCTHVPKVPVLSKIVPACGWAFIIGLRQYWDNWTCLIEDKVSNNIPTLYMVVGTMTGQSQGVQ